MEFVYEDGHGNAVDETGRHVLEMEVDENEFPLDNATDYDAYLAEKPPERQKKKAHNEAASSTEPTTGSSTSKRIYNAYSDMQKEQFFFLYHEKHLTAGKAAAKLGIPRSTAYSWLKKDEEEPSDEVQPRKVPEKRGGRPRLLNETHQQHVTAFIDDNPSVTLDQMMTSLTEQFDGLKVSGSTLHRFVHDHCSITFKKAHLHSKERNSPEKIQARYDWATEMRETDMDFTSNCVFIDESAFHVNIKRSGAWSRRGTGAEVIAPQTR
ncbi:hypothetical protein BCR43DRAFT_551887 [Syncephalastrum racemosum]|uniref:Homeodomain-like protein n=1 Tax=Syncephalastrum racemosum TaxID=13706 RepID=A0A1X2H6I6_SYNRA|nr:hypothetical protein BCR43DRAFT_551887 [Syncephalastrum racemosum]